MYVDAPRSRIPPHALNSMNVSPVTPIQFGRRTVLPHRANAAHVEYPDRLLAL
jgi:hypothetical protein